MGVRKYQLKGSHMSKTTFLSFGKYRLLLGVTFARWEVGFWYRGPTKLLLAKEGFVLAVGKTIFEMQFLCFTLCLTSTEDVVTVVDSSLTVKFRQMEVGSACRVTYCGRGYLVFKPERDVLELYELE